MDGYDSRASSGAFVYAFDPSDGALVSTIDATGIFAGTDLIEWVGDAFLTDDGFGPSGISFYRFNEQGVETRYALSVPGIPGQDYRGSTLIGDSLYVWSQRFTDTILTEIRLSTIPEPTAIWLILGGIMLTGLSARKRR
jgi:hypothetical protein